MNNFLKDIDFYYINLNKDVEKNKYMKKHLLKNNILNANRIEAINGKDEKISINNLSFSESGCVLSHIKAIKNFYYNSNNDYALFCEDDVNIDNIYKITFNFYETLMFYSPEMYCLQLVSITREDLGIKFNLRPRTFWDFSTAAYIINKKYAKLLLDNYSTITDIYKNFTSNAYVDPRGGIVNTRPVADELIYSLCKTYILPIFTVNPSESSISINDERYRQVIHSIKLFNDEWSHYDKINIERFFR